MNLGSGFADLFALYEPERPRWSMTIPPAGQFATVAGALGVSNHTDVVVHDRRENMWAARLWWPLRTFGFDRAAVLDGGWTAWQQGGYLTCSRRSGTQRYRSLPELRRKVGSATLMWPYTTAA